MSSASDWAEQARRLMESLRAAAPAAPAAAGSAGAAAGSASAAGASDCRWCPLCQAAAVVRGERPEVTAALADILSATAAALRQFAGEAAAPAPEAAPDTGAGAAGGEQGPPVQRIEIA